MTFLRHQLSESNILNSDRTTILCYRAMNSSGVISMRISESKSDFNNANLVADEAVFNVVYGGVE